MSAALCLFAAVSASAADLTWKDASGVKIPTPPAEHPRLYLRAEQAAQLAQRLVDPVLQPLVERLQKAARRSPQARAEWDALQYLISRDEKLGRATIESALTLLGKCELEDKRDACRATGRMMVTGAIVYDWCYSLLTPDQKKSFIRELVRLAKTQECGYPPTRQGSVTGHSSEAMIMRDMISAGIAIHDEFPEMYDLAAGRFFAEHVPARNWLYHGHAYHQGDSYGAHRYSWDTYPLWIFARLGAGNVYNPEQRFVPYWWVYTTRPDGQRMRGGDTFMSSTPRGRPWSEFVGTIFTASYYGDGTLLSQYLKQGGSSDSEALFEFLWRDTQLQPKPLEALPTSRYFGSPFGWMVARTGWDDNAVVAEMKINEYNFVNHQHLDAGAFQIYHKGPLAMDTGLYSGSAGQYGSPHCANYSWRTIAHNALLIHDPKEDFGKRGYGNDGGQRLPHGRSEARDLNVLLDPNNGYRTGKVLAHGFGPASDVPDYTLLQGDITAAYSAKVRQVVRSFVFLNLRNRKVPGALIVFDRVVSADPAFHKYWLLHTLEEPQIKGTSATADCTQHDQRGRLTLDVLLPAADNLALGAVGGPGKEYWVFGQNFTNDPDPGVAKRGSLETAAWRVEVAPKKAAAEDLFLNVLQMSDRTAPARLAVQRVDAGPRTGAVLQGDDAAWVVLLRKDSVRDAQPVQFSVAAKSPCKYLVTDLAPGTWQIRRNGSSAVQTCEVPESSGAAWFEGPAGEWTLSR